MLEPNRDHTDVVAAVVLVVINIGKSSPLSSGRWDFWKPQYPIEGSDDSVVEPARDGGTA
jgi:hypothetical protein